MAGRENSSDLLDRRLPYDLDAEQGVLGSILLLPEACDEVSLVLRPTIFSTKPTAACSRTCRRCTTRAARST